MAQRALDSLVQFARVVSDTTAAQSPLPLLCSALVQEVRADAVAVVALSSTGHAEIVCGHELPTAASVLELDADALAELGPAMLRASAPAFTTEVSRPLVASGGLFGAVVMMFAKGNELPETKLHLAEGLIDLAAVALGTASHIRTLEQQYAELRASQEMLARTEKLRALGQMAAGVSHDLRNILNPLSLHLQVMQRALDRGKVDDAKECIPEMKQVVVRGVQTLERLRDYSRQTKENKTELVDLDRLVREAAEIAKPRMAASGGGRTVRIREELASPPRVMAMSGEIVSALVNLVVNAIDAFAGTGGTITLKSGDADGGSWIEVGDNGPGMPPDVQKRVFEPFFTTKGSDGTGLGLANVYATMQRHGGNVAVDTAPGKGTRFRLYFPPAAVSGRR